MNNQINENFILAIKKLLPPKTNLAETLADVLCLSKESIYRRLRNEIPFTFNEIVNITTSFGLSLDKLLAKENNDNISKWAAFDTESLFLSPDYSKQYCNRLQFFIDIFKNMQQAKKSIARCAYNIIPYSFLLPYNKLSLLWHYKWYYLIKGVYPDFRLSQMYVTDEQLEAERKFVEATHKIPRTVLILDSDIFRIMLNDIIYFASQQLISKQELQDLKYELLDLVDKLSILTESGIRQTGAEVMIYLSKVNIDAGYFHLEYDDYQQCFQKAFFIDSMDYYNLQFCKKQKEWIESLKRFSIPITQTNEHIRLDYFNKQRRQIEKKLQQFIDEAQF